MKKNSILLIGLLFILFALENAYADCRGCCSGRGGLVCVNGVTKCRDGNPLSQKCINKGCDVCPEQDHNITSSNIKIASFNIQVFGRTKASKPDVMEILAETITQFDIIAIQEIRDKSGTAIKKLEVAVDDLGTNYDFIIGPRLGRTTSKEQYAFFYKTNTIEFEDSYTFNDSENDDFHREPFIAKFKIKSAVLDFIVINIHVDPDEADSEINALTDVIDDAKQHFSETDVILVGDLNADCDYFNENDTNAQLRNSAYTWRIENDMDTNVATSSCTYDRIITTSSLNEDYAGTSGVFRFDLQFELDCEPKEVSDHYPVYSEFHLNSDTD